jgi:polysaccharide export outer membrane protein
MRKSALLSSTTFRLVLCALCFAGFDPTGLLAESAPAPRSAGKKVIVYKIRAADRLGVRVFQEDDLTSTPRVDAKGTINLPLVRELRVDGLTINEAERLVENAYREGRFLRKPQVTITVEEYGPRSPSAAR